jgi:uncharacterized membrane protein YfcA
MPDLALGAWLILGVGAILVGFAKTAIGGLVSVAVALYAAVLPTKLSTGTLLVLLLMGDLVAVRLYRRDVDWKALGRLVPPVVVGVLLGAWFVRLVDDSTLRRAIGIMLLAMVALYFLTEYLRRRGGRPTRPGPADGARRRAANLGYGAVAGFTTMAANSGGPAMTLYFVSAKFPMLRFLGTSAWFFFLVNLLKLPFSIGLGLIQPSQLLMCAAFCPLVLGGAWLGRVTIGHLPQAWFNTLVMAFSAVPAAFLLF